jgi:hypothetical protein
MKPLLHQITPEQLEEYAWEYIQECMNHKKEQATSSGKVVLIKERHLPTIAYFLKIWLPLNKQQTICRATYYNWLKREDPATMDTIKTISNLFASLAIDIIANDNKGVGALFYSKNFLGLSDREAERKEIEPVTGMVIIDSADNKIENQPIIYINETANN